VSEGAKLDSILAALKRIEDRLGNEPDAIDELIAATLFRVGDVESRLSAIEIKIDDLLENGGE
jgi:hypothetical protein